MHNGDRGPGGDRRSLDLPNFKFGGGFYVPLTASFRHDTESNNE